MKSVAKEITEAPRMYETENDLPEAARIELAALINLRLADAIDLQMQLKQAHWNVKGLHFIGLHELFDKIAEDVESYVDTIAERVVQLGGDAEGTVRMSSARSRLAEYRFPSGMALLTWKQWRGRSLLLGARRAQRSMRRERWAMPTPRTFSPRFRGVSISGCGLWKPIPKLPNSGIGPGIYGLISPADLQGMENENVAPGPSFGAAQRRP
jgi:hypothetical protein